MPINHRGIIVNIDGDDFFVDVGFGGPMPAGALLIKEGEEQLIYGETYSAEPAGDSWWKIDRVTRAELDLHDDNVPSRKQTELELCTAAVEEQDFDSLNTFFSMPGTLFHDHALANLRTPNGYLALRDNVLTIRDNGEKTVIELNDEQEINEALKTHFGMDL